MYCNVRLLSNKKTASRQTAYSLAPRIIPKFYQNRALGCEEESYSHLKTQGRFPVDETYMHIIHSRICIVLLQGNYSEFFPTTGRQKCLKMTIECVGKMFLGRTPTQEAGHSGLLICKCQVGQKWPVQH